MSSVHDSENQLFSSEDEQYEEDHHARILDRPSKRIRTDSSKQKPPRKKYVKGRQGGLQGIMKMPMEVFMEIAHHVHPVDLISLIRTNNFFRSMLLNKSSILIWQRVLSNVPELPPCPTGLMEPQYAALMFSKNCTFCGALARSKPDPYLRVRLCTSCRDTELEEVPRSGFNFLPSTMHIKRTQWAVHKHSGYCLRTQREEFQRVEDEFVRNNDNKGLDEWRLQRHQSWDIQCKDGKQLMVYLNSATVSRLGELNDLKSERREQIHERLRALGWEDQYLRFDRGNAERQWNLLVGVSKPLTDRTWTNMLPKLTQLLEENRAEIDKIHQRQHRCARILKAEDLLRQLRRDTHPYQSIINALQMEGPLIQTGFNSLEYRLILPTPFPDNRVIRGWDFFTNLYEEENSIERVEELFNERQETICQELLEWRTQVEDQLVEQYKLLTQSASVDPGSTDTILTILGSTDATRHLSKNARFLLRADTVFMSKVTKDTSDVDQEHGPVASCIHFPNMPFIRNYLYPFDDTFDQKFNQDIRKNSLGCYVRHAGKEAIVKALLKELQMPDIGYIELGRMHSAFVCGRCNHGRAMEWDALVEHYHSRRRDWLGNRFIPNTYRTRHPIIFRNLHDLEPHTNPKPLVRIVSGEYKDTTIRWKTPAFKCIICHGIELYQHSTFGSLTNLKEHLLESHDIAEPVEDLHLPGGPSQLDKSHFWTRFNRENWEQQWDCFHDAHGSGSVTAHQTEIWPESTSQSVNSP